MENLYQRTLSILICVFLIGNHLSAQVYEIASGDLYYARSVSKDGVVVINAGPSIYTWDKDNGLVMIGQITNGYSFAGQASISEDGSKITASYTNPENNLNEISLYDVATQTWTNLGGIVETGTDGYRSSAWGISKDGTTIVGLGNISGSRAHAVKWTEETGMVDLGTLIETKYSRANAINLDKTVIVGWQDNETGFRSAARWVNGVETYLKDNNGKNIGEAGAVSDDGKTIVGYNGIYPYVWNETSGYQEITHPDAGPFFKGGATGISGDGKKVIGFFRPFPGAPMGGTGFIWTPEDGRKDLSEYLTSLGIDTLGFKFGLPNAISTDGTKIVGVGINASNKIAAFYIDTEAYLNVKQSSKINLSISPNPVKDILTISGDKISAAEIYNMTGQKVKSSKIQGNKIDVSTLAKGIYILQVTLHDTKQNLKFIKD